MILDIFFNRVELKSTKAFIAASNLPHFRGRLGLSDSDEIFENKGRSGLWFHRVLALKFAAWLNPEFEVWIYITIDELLFGQLPELAQKSFINMDAVSVATNKLHETEEYKAQQLLIIGQKRLDKAIKMQQVNQVELFKPNTNEKN